MSQRIKGPPRTITDQDVHKLRAWRPFKELCAELGISRTYAYHIRGGREFKKPCPSRSK